VSEQATAAMEDARRKVARFINARSWREVVWTRNTTEAINLVAQSWGRANLRPGDRILLSEMEHHSNLVPWQIVAAATGAELDFIPIDGAGRLALDDLATILTERTRIVAVTHMSNVLGTINPVERIVATAKAVGALVLIDGAQSVPHFAVDVQALGIDFLAFSGHKMCGPTGIGVLWGRRELLQAMPPFLGGGSMIKQVTLRGSTYAEPPAKFEAGTPAIAEAIGLGAAVDYLSAIGMDRIHAAEQQLTQYALDRLVTIRGLTLYGPPVAERGGVISFNVDGVHPHDVAAVLDRHGVAVRAGHHCCQPLMEIMNVPATARASFYLYTTTDEIEQLADAIERCKAIFVREAA
jgi:cysteine desulfurase / selenocysteine lyase